MSFLEAKLWHVLNMTTSGFFILCYRPPVYVDCTGLRYMPISVLKCSQDVTDNCTLSKTFLV